MLTPLKTLLNNALRKSKISEPVTAAIILNEFMRIAQELFGQDILEKVKPVSLKNKILTVACLSSVLAQEIHLRKEEMIHKINQKHKDSIEKIRFLL